MPGIVGIYSKTLSKEKLQKSVSNMQKLITHKETYRLDPIFSSKCVSGTRSYINVYNDKPQPYSTENIHVWLDGEIHNAGDLLDISTLTTQTEVELLHSLYRKNMDLSFLAKIDGGYSAVIYDELNDVMHIISDRYGRQHLYWVNNKHCLAWASEIKAFRALPNFNMEIDPMALEEFLGIGYMIEDRTWIKGVNLLPAASSITFKLEDFKSIQKKYWCWDQINPLDNSSLNYGELIVKTGDLFEKAVETQYEIKGTEPGIALSGGRDSRAILAAMPVNGQPLHAVTYGKKDCKDIHYASKSIKTKKGIHHVYEMNASNWLVDRVKSIWWTDGQVNFIHLNGATQEPKEISYLNSLFSGLGGELLAGKYNSFKIDNIAAYINNKYSNSHFTERLRDRLIQYIKNFESPDLYNLDHRFRRFSAMGLKRGEAFGVRVRVPFLDNELVEHVLSIPEKYKINANLYDTILLSRFPEYFEDLDWKNTEASVGIWHKMKYYNQKTKKRIYNKLEVFGFDYGLSYQLADYGKWIREEPGRTFFSDLIHNKRALYTEYLDRSMVTDTMNKHLNGVDNTTLLCRYVTFEIWLQQLINNELRH